MSDLRHFLTELLIAISDHGNELLSKVINKIGLLSVGSGVTLGAVNDTASKVLQQTSEPWGLPDYAAIVSIVVGCTAFVKYLVDIYFKFKNDGR